MLNFIGISVLKVKVRKHSGDLVPFEIEKLRQSLLKSGAESSIVATILDKVVGQLYDGIPTKQIYKWAFELLKKNSDCTAARYNLRSALEMLGPAGFYFEKYLEHLFQYLEYQTVMNQILQGKSVSHEIDLVLKKNEQLTAVECKFHSQRESTTDVKVPMYILSRWNDLRGEKYSLFEVLESIDACLIVTNTRFSEDAIMFSKYYGLALLSWDFPFDKGLKELIDTSSLYPITCLTTLSSKEKKSLLEMELIVVSQIESNLEVLGELGLSLQRIKGVLREIKGLCNLK